MDPSAEIQTCGNSGEWYVTFLSPYASLSNTQFVVSSSIVASVTPFIFVDHSGFLNLQLITKIGFIFFAEIIFYL